MDIFQAVILGIVQGLTEMLPISSSGHLALAPWLLGWEDPGLTFDVALHVGTLLSVIAVFWRDWARMLGALGTLAKTRKIVTFDERMVVILVIASVPGAAAGFLLEDAAATTFRSPIQIGVLLILAGIVLWVADRWPARIARKQAAMNLSAANAEVSTDGGDLGKPYEAIGFKEGLIIGAAQALAIMPGVSRSGVTMTAGLFAGLSRQAVARFSFLLSTPIILGAAIFQLRHMFEPGAAPVDTAFVAGCIASAVVGFLAIKFLLGYLQKHTFNIFVVYRLIFGGFIIGLALYRG